MASVIDIRDLRNEYCQQVLKREDLHTDPVEQFRLWFNQATQVELVEPNAMILATIDSMCKPDTRTVLLKAFDTDGFVFYTNYESKKAIQMEANPWVSVTFPWYPLERQVIINGRVSKISTAESLKYYLSRPRGSQLGAWVSQQSQVISSRKILESKLKEMQAKFAKGDIPLPSFWGGYRIRPHQVEFWQGGTNRLHDRFRYLRIIEDENRWQIDRLSP